MIELFSSDNQFYPTPKEFAKKILQGLDFAFIGSVLEPSAGKGDLVNALKEVCKEKYYSENKIDIDCIEIDKNLQHILRGEGFRVVYDDFLTFETYKKYNLILMNPPFDNGDKHLLKALKIQEDGGNIICILNAETIKNPYSNTRKELIKKLNEHNADIEYFQNIFSNSERKTNVEIAVVKVDIPQKGREKSEIYEKMKKAKGVDEINASEVTDLAINDFISAAIQSFELEVASGIELIRQYNNLVPYIHGKDGNFPVLTFSLYYNGSHKDVSINAYLKSVRLKYWRTLLSNPKFIGKLTRNLQREYGEMVQELQHYDFNEYNIKIIAEDMYKNINKGIKETIDDLFDKLTIKYTYYSECKNNTHYYNGWCHNKAHKINNKVIIPCYDVYYTFRSGDTTFYTWKAVEFLQDIQKVLDYLDCGETKDVDLNYIVEQSKNNPKNIECKYFKVTFYKKGTCHITFTNTRLLDKFNIYAAKNRNWLPPDYGTKKYKNLSDEEKEVVDNFQGEKEYNKIYNNQNYYLQSANVPLLTQNN